MVWLLLLQFLFWWCVVLSDSEEMSVGEELFGSAPMSLGMITVWMFLASHYSFSDCFIIPFVLIEPPRQHCLGNCQGLPDVPCMIVELCNKLILLISLNACDCVVVVAFLGCKQLNL